MSSIYNVNHEDIIDIKIANIIETKIPFIRDLSSFY